MPKPWPPLAEQMGFDRDALFLQRGAEAEHSDVLDIHPVSVILGVDEEARTRRAATVMLNSGEWARSSATVEAPPLPSSNSREPALGHRQAHPDWTA